MAKKLTDFSEEDIKYMDYILYTLFHYNNGSGHLAIRAKYVKEQCLKETPGEGSNYAKSIVEYLLREYYIYGKDTQFNISSKGKVICKNGGLGQMYERKFADIQNSKRAKRAYKMAIVAIILSAVIPISIEIIKLIFANQ